MVCLVFILSIGLKEPQPSIVECIEINTVIRQGIFQKGFKQFIYWEGYNKASDWRAYKPNTITWNPNVKKYEQRLEGHLIWADKIIETKTLYDPEQVNQIIFDHKKRKRIFSGYFKHWSE